MSLLEEPFQTFAEVTVVLNAPLSEQEGFGPLSAEFPMDEDTLPRGVGDNRCIDGLVDSDGFVSLIVSHQDDLVTGVLLEEELADLSDELGIVDVLFHFVAVVLSAFVGWCYSMSREGLFLMSFLASSARRGWMSV